MMYKLNFIIKTESPIIINTNANNPNTVSSISYLPGTQLYGLFAWHYINQKNLRDKIHTNKVFRNFFLENKLYFENAYPFDIQKFNKYNDMKKYHPTPLYIQRSKSDDQKYVNVLMENDEHEQKIKVGNFVYMSGNNVEFYLPPMQTNFHFGRKKDGKKKDIFYYEAIDSDQYFTGAISSENEDILKEFQKNYNNIIYGHLGRSKSTQYGKVKIEFNDKIEKYGTNYNKDGEFILQFLSDAIFFNNAGISTVDNTIIKEYLASEFNVKIDDLKFEQIMIDIGYYQKYVSVWKMKSNKEITVKAGSTIIFKSTKLLNTVLDIKFIGERNIEGLGQISIKPYIEGNLQLNVKSNTDKAIDKPKLAITKLVTSILKASIDAKLINKVKKSAIFDSSEFIQAENSILPPNSLLRRLEEIVIQSPEILVKELKNKKDDKFAKNLYKCNNKSINLFDFICEYTLPEKKERNTAKISRSRKKRKRNINQNKTKEKLFKMRIEEFMDMGSLTKHVDYNPLSSTIKIKELYSIYWGLFFRYMQKEVNK